MLRIILIAAAAAVVTYAEKVPHTAHAPLHARIETGIVLALPFLIVVLWLSHREAKAKAPASETRTTGYGYSFRQPGRRG
jgi:ABC-type uncharacterized transport system permease subunit